ncbi:MAG: magnesium and cobalt transport protein CorA, partial [Pleurocapsa sp.]
MSYEPKIDRSSKSEAEEEEDLFDYAYEQPGSMPGTLTIEADAEHPDIILIDYNSDRADRLNNLTPEQCIPYLETNSVSWVDLKGLGS